MKTKRVYRKKGGREKIKNRRKAGEKRKLKSRKQNKKGEMESCVYARKIGGE